MFMGCFFRQGVSLSHTAYTYIYIHMYIHIHVTTARCSLLSSDLRVRARSQCYKQELDRTEIDNILHLTVILYTKRIVSHVQTAENHLSRGNSCEL